MKQAKKVRLYSGFEMFWHWAQALLVLFLGFTGFEVHGSYSFLGFRDAARYHEAAAFLLIALIAFAAFWHFTTGEWRQYVPTAENLRAQLEYYVFGIFRDAPHPVKKLAHAKLNPLQKLAYFGLKVFLFPALTVSGLVYMYYRYQSGGEIRTLSLESIGPVAVLHTACAFALAAFLIGHLYMLTTGATVTSNLKAMLTGFEELEDGAGEAK